MQSKTGNLGAWLVLLSTVFYASHGVWSKWLNPYFADVFSTTVVRSILVMILLAPWLLRTKAFKRIQKADRKWLAAMALPGGMVTPIYFYSFQHLSVGVATLTFFIAFTLAAMVFGMIFFTERLTGLKVLALGLGLTGLLTITSADFGRGAWLPVVLTGFAGVFGACELSFSKKISERYSVFYLTFLLYLVTLAISLPFLLAGQGLSAAFVPEVGAWAYSFGYAVAIVSAMGLAFTGYKYVNPGVGGIIGLAEAVFGVLFGILIFSERLTLAVAAGAAMILLAAALPILSQKEQ